ncbi:MAG TPA: phosphatidylserine/phosphatidylglycerophosphate/cardiolipin synthase family protein [Nitrospirota bacterium]|nr:phosphatidylserine/phosphatidylglycerophosphate/cardiolipin synthase family protein [Nitrospirota bacterium]
MTSIRLLKNGEEMFPAMYEAIEAARSCIAVEMYIIADDATGREFRDHLVLAAGRGIPVSVLVDAVGSWQLPDVFWNILREAGGTVRWFRPFRGGLFLFRNHRKLVLIDDHVAFIGGMNIADEYYRGIAGGPPWRDNALQITGMETARLRRSFERMWLRAELPFRKKLRLSRNHAGHLTVSRRVRFLESGPEDPMHPVRRVYRQIVGNAVTSIDLAMSYFYPSGRMLRALRKAVERGVRVRLLFPQWSDVAIAKWAAQGLYGRLLKGGMEVWEYRLTMLHSKLAVADDTVIAGSANLDIRSGRINYELVAVVNDPEVSQKARADFQDDLHHANRILPDAWRERTVVQKIKERVSYWLLARLDVFLAKAEMSGKMR